MLLHSGVLVIGKRFLPGGFDPYTSLMSIDDTFTDRQPKTVIIRAKAVKRSEDALAFLLRRAHTMIDHVGAQHVTIALQLDDNLNSSSTQEITLISQRLTRYDRLIARHAEEAGFDWRFIAALIFEESHFDHERVSEIDNADAAHLTPAAWDL